MSINPWQVESIQAFYFLKCPECTFTHKEESNFQTHAIENHPLSVTFFEKSNIKIQEIGILDGCNKNSESNDRFIRIKEEALEMGDDYENPENSEEIFQTENDSIVIKMEPECIIEEYDPLNLSNSIINSEKKFLNSEIVANNETTCNKSRDQNIIVKRVDFTQKLHPSSDSLSKKAQDILNESLGISNVKSFKCLICNSTFTSSRHMKNHISRVHEGKKPFECTLCDYSSSTEGNLKTHIEVVHEEQKPFKCTMPNDYQAEIETTHTCGYCDYTSSSIVYFNKHLKSHHICNECGKMFHGPNGKRNYERHLPTHQPKTPKPENPPKPPSQPREKKPEQSHACSTCDKVFPFMSYLERHIEKKHDSKSKRKIDFQIENELPSNATNEIPSVSQELPKKRRRKQQFVE